MNLLIYCSDIMYHPLVVRAVSFISCADYVPLISLQYVADHLTFTYPQ